MELSPATKPTEVEVARVLVLDPDAAVRDLVATALAAEQAIVVTVFSPEEAVRRLGSGERWDLLIADEALAGAGLLLSISKNHPGVGLVVTTAHPSLSSAVEAIRAGARDYLEKPVRDVRLARQHVRDLLRGRLRGVEERESVEELQRRNRELRNRATLLERKVSATQRNLREQLLLQQRAREVFFTDLSRVMAIFDHLADGIVFTNVGGEVILVNPSAGRMLETVAFSALGQPLAGLTGNRALLDVLIQHRDCGPGELGLETEVTTTRRAAGESCYTIHTSEVRDIEGKVSGVLTLIRDVSEQKKTEKLKNQFLSIVAHELRTPLTAIKSFATILDRGVGAPLAEAHRAPVLHILSQTDRLANEIDKIISLGRLEAEDFAPDLALVSVQDILRRLLAPFEAEAAKRGITLTLHDEAGDRFVHADVRDIRRAVRALVENALKFTPEGGTVDVRAVAGRDGVLFEVVDSGIGIAREHHQIIFEKFIQLENPLTRKYGGSGLGLSFASEIVEAHRSKIEVESELGKGACFRFLLPTSDATPEPEGEEGRDAAREEGR